MTKPDTRAWISIVGIGEDGLDGVPAAGRRLIDAAQVLIGGTRHLAMIPDTHPAERMTWRSPLKDTVADITARRDKDVCILATGDPMSYGIGVTLGRVFGADALTVLPAPGAFSLAAARMGWPLEDVTRLTLHGRPLAILTSHVVPDARLLILSENGDTPANVTRHLTDLGYGESMVTVLSHMGGEAEQLRSTEARDWGDARTPDLNTMAVECRAGRTAKVLARVPGLPDDAFDHDGQLTKREVRAATLAKLMPRRGAVLWDVGAGCGSVAIEWMRAGGHAVAVERDATRLEKLNRNAIALGVPQLEIVSGEAPHALTGLNDTPDAIFIGGGISDHDIAAICWDRLAPGGVLVANAVTMEGEARLTALFQEWGGDLARIAVSRLEPVGPYHGWRPLMPVTQYSVRKTE